MADWTSDERDFLLQCLFECQRTVAAGVDLLFRAVTRMRNLKVRQAYLLKFFETVRATKRDEMVRSQILTHCFFSPADITLLVEALQSKITEKVQLQ